MDWDAKDTALLLGALGGTYADYASTREILEFGGKEHNPLLGEHPSKAKLKNYFASAGLGTIGAAALIPKEWRRPLLAGLAATEFTLAHDNKKRKGKQEPMRFYETMQKPLAMGILAALLTHTAMGKDTDGSGLTVGAQGSLSIGYTKKF
jgi:hypothetical protein